MQRPYNRRPSGVLAVVYDHAQPPQLGGIGTCEIDRRATSNCNYISVFDYGDIQLRDLFQAIVLVVTWLLVAWNGLCSLIPERWLHPYVWGRRLSLPQ